MIRLPLFNLGQRIVNENGQPTTDFLTALNAAFRSIVGQGNTNEDMIEQIANALAQVGIALGQAEAATATANAIVNESSLVNSYVSPDSVLGATLADDTATISVSAHTRVYGNGTSVTVAAGGVPDLDLSTVYYVFYDDLGRVGGSVTYQVSTDPTEAAQGGARHCVGSVQTPEEGVSEAVGGITTRPPGVPYWKFPAAEEPL